MIIGIIFIGAFGFCIGIMLGKISYKVYYKLKVRKIKNYYKGKDEK